MDWQPRMLSVLRIVAGFLFIEHGGQKLLNFPPSPHPMSVPVASLLGVAGLLELIGGGMLILGLLTRPAAFILAGEMAVAYFMQHSPHGFWPVANQGEPAVLYCFTFLFFAVAGGGVWSLDALFARIREKPDSELATGPNRQVSAH